MRSSSEPSRYALRGDLSEQLLDGQLLGDRMGHDARLGGDRGDGPYRCPDDRRHGGLDALGERGTDQASDDCVVLGGRDDPAFLVAGAGPLVQYGVRSDRGEQGAEVSTQPDRNGYADEPSPGGEGSLRGTEPRRQPMTNGLVFLKVTFDTGTELQFGLPDTVNLILPVMFLPAKRPDDTLPVMVATVMFEPVPVLNVSV